MTPVSCWLCPSFTHWTTDVVGVRRDAGFVFLADRDCADANPNARDRIVDAALASVREVVPW